VAARGHGVGLDVAGRDDDAAGGDGAGDDLGRVSGASMITRPAGLM
jgi:hypothetical protein